MFTVNDVRDGLFTKLKQIYPASKVTGEEIKQGLGSSQFFVKLITTGQSRGIDRRRRRVHSFDVRFFGETNEEMHRIAEALYAGLEQINTPSGTIRGAAMRHEIVDEVLHFFVDYTAHVMIDRPSGVKMNSMEQEGFLK